MKLAPGVRDHPWGCLPQCLVGLWGPALAQMLYYTLLYYTILYSILYYIILYYSLLYYSSLCYVLHVVPFWSSHLSFLEPAMCCARVDFLGYDPQSHRIHTQPSHSEPLIQVRAIFGPLRVSSREITPYLPYLEGLGPIALKLDSLNLVWDTRPD